MKECAFCSNPIENGGIFYQVMIYKKDGNQVYEHTCSEKCANSLRERPIRLHQSMVDDMRNQCIQKILNK